MIAKTFLRLERDFDKHVTYCRDEPIAQEFLANNDEVRDFFEVNYIRIKISLLVLTQNKSAPSIKNIFKVYKP